MTFTDIQTEASNRLNITSAEGLSRIGSYINQRYRRLTSSLGLNTTRRATQSINTVAGTATITFTSLEKIELVYITTNGRERIIREMPYEEFRRRNVEEERSGIPTEYAVTAVTSNSVTIGLYPTPNAIISITADGLNNASTLSGSDVPAFPADFHDALVLGAMSDEFFKMEKYALAKDFELQFKSRESDLRMFLAKSAFISMAEAEYPGGGLITVVRRHRSS